MFVQPKGRAVRPEEPIGHKWDDIGSGLQSVRLLEAMEEGVGLLVDLAETEGASAEFPEGVALTVETEESLGVEVEVTEADVVEEQEVKEETVVEVGMGSCSARCVR